MGSEERDGGMVNYAHLSKPRWSTAGLFLGECASSGRKAKRRKDGDRVLFWFQVSVEPDNCPVRWRESWRQDLKWWF